MRTALTSLCASVLVVVAGGCSGTPEMPIAEEGARLGEQGDFHMQCARVLHEQGKLDGAIAELTAAERSYRDAARKMDEAIKVHKERIGSSPDDPYDYWSEDVGSTISRLFANARVARQRADKLKTVESKTAVPASEGDGAVGGDTRPAIRIVPPLALLPSDEDTNDADALFLEATKVLFFEGGAEPATEPTYATRFPRTSTRRIYTYVEIANAFGNAQDITTRLVLHCYKADGNSLGGPRLTPTIPGGSESFTVQGSLGAEAPGNWEPGTYTVKVEAGGVPIGSGSFTIHDE